MGDRLIADEPWSNLSQAVKNYFSTAEVQKAACLGEETHLTGCSKRSSSKATSESKSEAYARGYVEGFGEQRMPLADFFSIRVEGLTLAGAPNVRRPQAAVDVHRAACDRLELNTYGSSSDDCRSFLED